MSQQLTFRTLMRHACLILLLAVASATRPDSQLLAAEPTLEQLKADLRSADVKVRRKAASELGKTQSHEAVQPLLSAASDRDVSVREEVVKSLGLLKDQEALTMLLTTIKDPAESVREESIIALVNLYADRDAGWVVTRTAKKVYKTVNPFSDRVGDDATIIEAYVQVAPMVIDSIADRLVDSSPAIRLDAAKALGVLRARPAVARMIDAMKTGDVNLRIAVLRSLYKIRETSVDEQIMPYLNDSDKNVRDETIVTLGLFRSKKALPELKGIYDQNPDTKLRLKAFQALALIGDGSTLDLFQRNLRDPDKAYRQAAAEGIGRIGEASLVEEVSRTFLSEKDLGAQLAQSFALYRLGRKEFLDKLLMGLTERMYYQQPTAYLVEMGAAVVPDLTRNLNHENAVVRERLCGVLGLIGDSSTIEQLKPLLQDSSPSVASEAAVAIRRLGASS
ncbi:MAG TPA: HEAT repeat domain-containing protein [Terriglobia bacterium]|nr:HEAT repeat domain-containing protein [Terriglobia bacterium]